MVHEANVPLKCPNSESNSQDERAICHICGLLFRWNDAFMSHVKMCQNEVTPKNNVRIPPPPAVPATSIGLNNVNTPSSVEKMEPQNALTG